MPNWLVGVDTGGTFTDLIAMDPASGVIKRAKSPSVPGDPSLAVLDVLEHLFADGVAPADISLFVHGATVATNALLEGKGVRTGLLITRGFRAVYEARGWSQPTGADLLDTFYQKPPLLAPQALTEEVTERIDFEGQVVTALDEEALRLSVRRLREEGVEAIAVCFLFSSINPDHERRAAEIIAEEAPGVRISLSSNVLPVVREYPRLSTTVIVGYRKARNCKPAVLYELLNSSLGGTSSHDGAAIVMAMNHFTPGAPVEIFESEYPVRVRAFELVQDSAGAGKYRGGLGYAREFEVLEDSTLTVRSSNHRFTSQGLNGGGAPKPSRVVLNPHLAGREELGPLETRFLKAGDVIRFERSGGAGFGPVAERDREAICDDVRNGYVSAEAAASQYGFKND